MKKRWPPYALERRAQCGAARPARSYARVDASSPSHQSGLCSFDRQRPARTRARHSMCIRSWARAPTHRRCGTGGSCLGARDRAEARAIFIAFSWTLVSGDGVPSSGAAGYASSVRDASALRGMTTPASRSAGRRRVHRAGAPLACPGACRGLHGAVSRGPDQIRDRGLARRPGFAWVL